MSAEKSKIPTSYTLKIAEALQEDIDKGIARVSSDFLDKIGMVSGDTVQLKAKQSLVVRLMRVPHRKTNQEVIRIDGTTRSHLGTSIGDAIEVIPLRLTPAQSVTLAPLRQVQFSDDPTEYFHNKLLDLPLVEKQKVVIDVFGTRLTYAVSKIMPKEGGHITSATQIKISDEVHSSDTKSTGVTYEDIGGLKNELELIREMVELPMKHPEVFQKLGVGAPKGVLLTGPPGTGKTLLAKAVAHETDASFYSIAGPEIMSKYYGESEKHLRDVFEKAEKNAPSIIFIDEIDSIAPKRGETQGEVEHRVVAQLLTLMDGLKSRGQVVVMAATNRPEYIDQALRRPGRFDRELRINPPDESGRKEILRIHTRGMPLESDVNFDELAYKTIGYVGADLEVLCKEAALKSIKPYFAELKNLQEKVPTAILDKIKVTRTHFLEAMKHVEPSALREVLIQKPHVTWEDIGGLEDVKEKLRELIELPLVRPDLFAKAGIKPSKGILLSGPSGTGKTLLAKAVANEANANFISVKGPELISKWVGESEKHVREIFKKARQVAPCIIFFDEFDSISKHRGASLSDATERMVNQLLTELDGIEELEKVMIIAATNRRDLIDPALLRSGRIDSIVELPIPDEKTRHAIFKVHSKTMPLESGFSFNELVKKTSGWTGADIEAVCRNAGLLAIKRSYTKKAKEELLVTKDDFEKALTIVASSTNKSLSSSGFDKKYQKKHESKIFTQ